MICILHPTFSYLETQMLQQAPGYACSRYFLSVLEDFVSFSQYTWDLAQLLTHTTWESRKESMLGTHRGNVKRLKQGWKFMKVLQTEIRFISQSLVSKDFIFQFTQPWEGGRSHYEKSCYSKGFTNPPGWHQAPKGDDGDEGLPPRWAMQRHWQGWDCSHGEGRTWHTEGKRLLPQLGRCRQLC